MFDIPEPFVELCNLVEYHIIDKREIYKVSSLRAAYSDLNKEESYPILRNKDIKD